LQIKHSLAASLGDIRRRSNATVDLDILGMSTVRNPMREVGEEQIQIFLIPELQFSLENAHAVAGMREVAGRDVVQRCNTGRRYCYIAGAKITGILIRWWTWWVVVLGTVRLVAPRRSLWPSLPLAELAGRRRFVVWSHELDAGCDVIDVLPDVLRYMIQVTARHHAA
jgi:hypothetical protein